MRFLFVLAFTLIRSKIASAVSNTTIVQKRFVITVHYNGCCRVKSLVCDETVSSYSLVRTELIELAPSVQKVDNAIPLDRAISLPHTYPLDRRQRDLSGGRRYPTFERWIFLQMKLGLCVNVRLSLTLFCCKPPLFSHRYYAWKIIVNITRTWFTE